MSATKPIANTTYRVSEDGNVYDGDKQLKVDHVTLHRIGCYRVDYLVAATFLPRPAYEGKGFYLINHKDGDINNSHKDNLEWVPWYLFGPQKMFKPDGGDYYVSCGSYYNDNYVFNQVYDLYPDRI